MRIAHGMGAQIIVRPWQGFVEARSYALGLVQTPLALFLDADEVLDATLCAAILAAEPPPSLAAYRMLRINRFCGKPIRGAGWYPEYLTRLFRPARVRIEAHPATGSGAALHERIVADGPVADLPGAIVHDSYPSIASYWRKFDHYTTIEAAALETSPRLVARAALIAVLRFGWLLFGRRAILDGWRGLVVAFGSALYPLAAHWKALRHA